MHTTEKQVSYRTTNTYETLNKMSEKTKNVWIVFHGIGFLSRYFLKYFDELPPEENYFIAPQAPSKYYLKNEYRHVGASWLTKENTALEKKNVLAYLDAVFEVEKIPETCKLIVFGFSQGVSIAMRWAAYQKPRCEHLILYAGGIPTELEPSDFDFIKDYGTKVKVLIGNQDEYINEDRLRDESKKIELLFNGKAEQVIYEGGHEIKKELINALI
ncbi:alpha/beta hydrolase [Maribacter algicola]|uniref:Alpha/beta hydrolase n=1 Tax=Meishania litoralis TaxID=3434685 RepID=A0ACC7LJZ9_9FLAO